MEKGSLMATTSVVIMVSSILVSVGLLVGYSFAQDNMTTATNDTGAMMGGNQTNQTGGGNETQQGPLEQLGEALGGVFGGGNQSQ
jgi:uncharacterized membrane protein